MPQLISKSAGKILAANLKQAKTVMERVQGLIRKKPLKETEALWIPSCPSIHTFFMAYPIDVIFTDKYFQVISLFENVCPGRILWGGWKGWNVFEMKQGQIKKLSLKEGDVLYVEH